MKSSLIVCLIMLTSLMTVATANAKQRHVRRRTATRGHVAAQSQSQEMSFDGGGGVRPGAACTASDRDPVKCEVCAIYGEDHGSVQGMHAVAGVIKTRARAGQDGGNVCAIVHARGQFIGAWHVLPNNPALLASMKSAAESASANGYMGFRSYCKPGRNTRIGGNCYGTASLDDRFIVLDPNMTQEDIDAQAKENIQFAEAEYSDDAA